MARARQRSCFCPWERLAPELEMGEERERNMFVFSLTAGLESAAVVEVALLVASAEEVAGLSSSGTGVLFEEGMRCTRSSAWRSCTSVNSSKGSRFDRMVPEKRTGSCGMMARRVRRSCSLMVEMSMPSMVMLPALAFRKRKRARESVDLPVCVSCAMLKVRIDTYQHRFYRRLRFSRSSRHADSSLSKSRADLPHMRLPSP